MSKFLIIEDSPIERYTLRKCLEKLGHEIIGEAKNSVEAIDLYQKLKPQGVILDIYLSNSNGIEVLEKIMTYDRSAKIIMCTSAATEILVIRASCLGAKYFLSKPIDIQSLAKVIKGLAL